MIEPTALLKPLSFDLVPADSALLPVRLVCGPQIVLGRNKEECDMVTWFLPRNEENDRETRKLSQVHTILRREGNHLRVRDADSASGTFWNQQVVPPGEGLTSPIGPSGKMSLGRNYGLSIDWFPVASPTSAVLRPVTSDPAFRRCLWMTGGICAVQSFPSEPGGPWLMPCAGSEAADAVIEVRGGTLWWQPASGEKTQFASGASLQLADITFQVQSR